MTNTTIVILTLFTLGCTPYKEYKYLSSSVLAKNDAKSTILYDSIMVTKIRPGYYFRLIPKDSTEQIDYNEIDWIYVSKNYQVKLFTTANYEYCMLDMCWKQKPKHIYKQIKKNHSEFDSLYLKCNYQEFIRSQLNKKNDWVISLGSPNDIIIFDELLFIKGGLIRKIRNYERIISMDKYEFIGD